LEVVLVDRRLGEDERLVEDHGLVRADRGLAELAGREGLPGLARQLPVQYGGGRVLRPVPELEFVPEAHLLRATGLDVRTHLARKPEPGESDLAAVLRLLEDAGGGRDAAGGGGV